MLCLKCNKDSGRSKFCRHCREKKQNAWAMVSQNKKKLVTLLEWDRLSPQWFEKFWLYCENIIKNWEVLMDYKKADTQRTFNNIFNRSIKKA